MLNTAIIGAGPYGLSIGAHLRDRGIPFRIFGKPMDSWLAHMPKGMMLKSDGFASNIYDPGAAFTLKQFCAERGIPYADSGKPVSLETFCAYGLAFRDRMLPNLEEQMVESVERSGQGFVVRVEGGETFHARRVILAVGITHFEYVPEALAHLPAQYLSHSATHREMDSFKGRSVAVIGGGASALDLAGLLHEAGADVQLISRRTELKFHSKPTGKPRSLWQRLRHPASGLGPGLTSKFFSDAPWVFHYLPEDLRLRTVQRALGPSGGYFVRDLVVDKLPLVLGHTPEQAEVQDGKVHLQLRSQDGSKKEVVVEHVIAATGYKVDLSRLTFLSPELRSQVRTVNGAPVLASTFESSVPGLYFTGIAAANSFGPVMRFAFGAGFAARRLAKALHKSLPQDTEVAVSAASTAQKVNPSPLNRTTR
jgi:thioredoxin reductase